MYLIIIDFMSVHLRNPGFLESIIYAIIIYEISNVLLFGQLFVFILCLIFLLLIFLIFGFYYLLTIICIYL